MQVVNGVFSLFGDWEVDRGDRQQSIICLGIYFELLNMMYC